MRVEHERHAMQRAVRPDDKRCEDRRYHQEDRVRSFPAQNSPCSAGLAGVLEPDRERVTTSQARYTMCEAPPSSRAVWSLREQYGAHEIYVMVIERFQQDR